MTPFGEDEVPPPSEEARGQLLRALAGYAIRGALERYFGGVPAFQNCDRPAAFVPAGVGSPIYGELATRPGRAFDRRVGTVSRAGAVPGSQLMVTAASASR